MSDKGDKSDTKDTGNTVDKGDKSVLTYIKVVCLCILAAPALFVLAFVSTLIPTFWPESKNHRMAWIIVVSAIIYGIAAFQIWESVK